MEKESKKFVLTGENKRSFVRGLVVRQVEIEELQSKLATAEAKLAQISGVVQGVAPKAPEVPARGFNRQQTQEDLSPQFASFQQAIMAELAKHNINPSTLNSDEMMGLMQQLMTKVEGMGQDIQEIKKRKPERTVRAQRKTVTESVEIPMKIAEQVFVPPQPLETPVSGQQVQALPEDMVKAIIQTAYTVFQSQSQPAFLESPQDPVKAIRDMQPPKGNV